jgi:hypothetical protein
VDDMDVIRNAIAALKMAEDALTDGESPDTVDRWLSIHRQWLYMYEHIGLPEDVEVEEVEEVEEEDDEDEDGSAVYVPPTTLNGTVDHGAERELPGDEEDDDPDDIARLGP